MTSESTVDAAFVWIWLPEAVEPIVAGRLARAGDRLVFNYGRSYLERADHIPIYAPELPLRSGLIEPGAGLQLASALRDAAPDAWGRRVILNRLAADRGRHADAGALDELTYLLQSGSDRIGALDFQSSSTDYVPRAARGASLEELLDAAAMVEQGIALTPELGLALFHGTSLGGARPKAMIEDGEHKWIAKFSSSTDTYNVVKGEYLAMRLAAEAGLDVAAVRLERAAGKDILLVRRFDRSKGAHGWRRTAMVSALTLFGLDEMMARYASYQDLAEIVRHRFVNVRETLHELFGRLVFNVICGNTDDHARNHAAFWDGAHLRLTPAYDICPQARAGNEASQAMLIVDNKRMSTLETCIEAAPQFHLDSVQAIAMITHQITVVKARWEDLCNEAGIAAVDKAILGSRMFLNPYIFEGAPEPLAQLAW